MDKWSFAAVAIVALCTMESIALYRGIDGAYFMPIVSLISIVIGLLFGVNIKLVGLKNEIQNKKKKEP